MQLPLDLAKLAHNPDEVCPTQVLHMNWVVGAADALAWRLKT